MNINPQIRATAAGDAGRARPEQKPEAEAPQPEGKEAEGTYSGRTTPQTGGYRTDEPLIRVDDEQEAGDPYSGRSTPQTGGYGGRSEASDPVVDVEDKVEIRGRDKRD